MDGGLFIVISSFVFGRATRACEHLHGKEFGGVLRLSPLGIPVHGKTPSKKDVYIFWGGRGGGLGCYGSQRHVKWRMAPQIGSSQHRGKKGHCAGKSFRHVVFTVVWLGEQHGHWPSLKFVGVLNMAELKSTFFLLARALKRRQKGAGWEREGEKERSYPRDRKLRGEAVKGWRRHS